MNKCSFIINMLNERMFTLKQGGTVYIKLRKHRESQKLTQKDVAEKAGITERGYQNYELGLRKPNVDTAIRIADALNSSVEELFR